MKIERMRIHFFSDVFSAVAVLGSYGPFCVVGRLGRGKKARGGPWEWERDTINGFFLDPLMKR